MNLNAKRPVFVPQEHWAEVEKMSKAALMDMVWDYCMRTAGVSQADGGDTFAEATLAEFRATRDIILHHRKGAKGHLRSDYKRRREARC
jgi:hypothetical protein